MSGIDASLSAGATATAAIASQLRVAGPPALLVRAMAWLVFGGYASVWLMQTASLSPGLAVLAPWAITWALDHHRPRLVMPGCTRR